MYQITNVTDLKPGDLFVHLGTIVAILTSSPDGYQHKLETFPPPSSSLCNPSRIKYTNGTTVLKVGTLESRPQLLGRKMEIADNKPKVIIPVLDNPDSAPQEDLSVLDNPDSSVSEVIIALESQYG